MKKHDQLAYLLRMYPRTSQTFIVNEILELEQQGVGLRIGSLRLPNEGVFHDSLSRVQAPVDYLPNPRDAAKVSRSIGRGNRRAPAELAAALRRLMPDRVASWEECVQAGLVVQWAAKRRIKHVHVHFGTSEATVAWLASLIGGPTYSLTLHAFDIFRNNVNRVLLARKINGSRFTVTVCQSNRDFMLRELPGVDAHKIRVNYNGVDLERFRPNGEQRDPARIFAVGRLIEKKGFIHLVRAVGLLRDRGLPVECEIAGEGRDKPMLKSEIDRLNLRGQVRLVGTMLQHEIRRRMQTIGCFALPCVEARDGNVDALPTVLLESLASGCPSVSTHVNGVPEIIESGVSGLLVAPRNEPALADALGKVLTDTATAQRLSTEGRRRATERFDVRRNVDTMRQWLLEALAESGTGATAKSRSMTLPNNTAAIGAHSAIAASGDAPQIVEQPCSGA